MRYLIKTNVSETERNGAYRAMSEILLSRGFPGRIGMDENLDFIYTTSKPLDGATIKSLENIPGVERVKALPERRWSV